jgi:ubiquinone/menaquinone biosynthesis C-methylase UbiE
VFPRICDHLLGKPYVAARRRELLAGVSGDILEIGFGTGLNLPHYPGSVRRITVVEPNAGMQRLARKRIEQAGIEVVARGLDGGRLPFEAGSFDTVVSTFTLCSIAEVERALAEVVRVLRPGGRFLYLEHGLSADPGVQKWQRRLNWLSRLLGDGCHLDRNIQALVGAQPFGRVDGEQFELREVPRTHGTLYRGVATR